jgi:hypothetical protein
MKSDGGKMNLVQLRKGKIVTFFIIATVLSVPVTVNAQAMKVTVHEITLDSDKYEGKMVLVEGTAKSIRRAVSPEEEYCTIFQLTQKPESTISLEVLAKKQLAIQEGDYVRVAGKYKKTVELACCWISRIYATKVDKVQPMVCPDQ